MRPLSAASEDNRGFTMLTALLSSCKSAKVIILFKLYSRYLCLKEGYDGVVHVICVCLCGCEIRLNRPFCEHISPSIAL